eukprot:TRINITY_DN2576_c0_g1_i2.p1 TRINITY_DN2576_c0_g1~~TRINITY_DN2576_c0_g1_i2.p1  ORF type:complete len:189 (+),score=25.37 TRINITY_DN2576_c0_g1_i2:207-773(+)
MTHREISLSKRFDPSSPSLLFSLLSKKTFPYVQIDTVREPFNEIASSIRLENVIISSYSQSWGRQRHSNPDDSGSYESLSLNFLGFKMIYNELDDFVERLARKKEQAEKFTEDQLTGVKSSNFGRLPPEHVFAVFSHLSKQDLVNASMACKSFFKVACDPRFLIIKQHDAFIDSWKSKHYYRQTEISQ